MAYMGEKRVKGVGMKTCMKRLWKGIGIEGRIILKQILKKQDGMVLTGYIWLRIETSRELL